jgi:putative phosphoesterase
MKIGLISDTHGLVRPEALRALRGVPLIIHAGDIGGPEVLRELETIAPVHAVRGNNDRGPWAERLPHTLDLELEKVAIHVIHDVKELAGPDGAGPPGTRVIIAGHSHKPSVTEREGVLWVNPGSAGPRRFSLPVAVGCLVVARGTARARIQTIL